MSGKENQHQNNSHPFRSFTPLLGADITADRLEIHNTMVQSVILYKGWSKSYKTVPDLNLASVSVTVVVLYMLLLCSWPDTPCPVLEALGSFTVKTAVSALDGCCRPTSHCQWWSSISGCWLTQNDIFVSLLQFEVREGIAKTPLTQAVLLIAQCQMDCFLVTVTAHTFCTCMTVMYSVHVHHG